MFERVKLNRRLKRFRKRYINYVEFDENKINFDSFVTYIENWEVLRFYWEKGLKIEGYKQKASLFAFFNHVRFGSMWILAKRDFDNEVLSLYYPERDKLDFYRSKFGMLFFNFEGDLNNYFLQEDIGRNRKPLREYIGYDDSLPGNLGFILRDIEPLRLIVNGQIEDFCILLTCLIYTDLIENWDREEMKQEDFIRKLEIRASMKLGFEGFEFKKLHFASLVNNSLLPFMNNPKHRVSSIKFNS